MTDYEPYVRDPAEQTTRRWVARLQSLFVALALLVLVTSIGTLYFVGRGEEESALTQPGQDAGG